MDQLAEEPSLKLQAALHRGVCFLEQGRSEDGLWRDFHTRAGQSSEWVTGFVAYALRQVDPANAAAASALTVLLRRQRPNGGWAYNSKVPADCDSTSWILLALLSGNQQDSSEGIDSAVRRAIEYVRRHQEEHGGGFCTYAASDGIDRYIEAAGVAAVQGWTHAHVCVTGPALQALVATRDPDQAGAIERAVVYLQQHREESGLWRSFWWQGYAYSTYHCLKGLMDAGALSLAELANIGERLSTQPPCTGVFEQAFLLLGLLLCRNLKTAAACEELARQLSTDQNADGSWPSVPILRIPAPNVKEPDQIRKWRANGEAGGSIVQDRQRFFTTAAVLWALATYQRQMSSRQA